MTGGRSPFDGKTVTFDMVKRHPLHGEGSPSETVILSIGFLPDMMKKRL